MKVTGKASSGCCEARELLAILSKQMLPQLIKLMRPQLIELMRWLLVGPESFGSM